MCSQQQWVGEERIYYKEIDSTNLEARRLARKGAAHGTLVVAEKQLAGKGRRGRQWESPEGVNIYFSILVRPTFLVDKASMLTMLIAHSVAKSIESITQLKLQIKWPNDILLQGKKVCGILTELSENPIDDFYVIIGVGINVGPQEFSKELEEKATYLEAHLNTTISKEVLLDKIMKKFQIDYEGFVKQGDLSAVLQSYHELLVNKDAKVRILDPKGEYNAVARRMLPTGELEVELLDGSIEYIYAGEVSVRGEFGYI